MTTMTLAEFLRARLSEHMDTLEQVLNLLERMPMKPGTIAVDGQDVYDVRLVQRDIEAKLRIVEGWFDPFGTSTAMEARAARLEKERILCLLAMPYADHPDYLEDWKP